MNQFLKERFKSYEKPLYSKSIILLSLSKNRGIKDKYGNHVLTTKKLKKVYMGAEDRTNAFEIYSNLAEELYVQLVEIEDIIGKYYGVYEPGKISDINFFDNIEEAKKSLYEFEKILLKTISEEINYFEENKKYENLKLEVVEEDDVNLGYTYNLFYDDILISSGLVNIDIEDINKYALFIAAINEYMSKKFKLNIILAEKFKCKFENNIKIILEKDEIFPFELSILIKNKDYNLKNVDIIPDLISESYINELVMENYDYNFV
ncbi:hypothetical protein [Clostridium thermobutyricum]|uniref:hypothetical protein n=1 Tax=Clostridium thermobutyricum TaxID=29372 RepID=UPI0018ABCFC7|nr:hypothetical protein [Clostridium thermobutyricum]